MFRLSNMFGGDLDSAFGAYRIYSEEECAEAPALDWPYVCALHLLRKPVESAVSEFLAFVGNASRSDRAWMIGYTPDLLRFRNTHEWCKGDTTAYISELQEVPTTLIAWLHRYLTEDRPLPSTMSKVCRAPHASFRRNSCVRETRAFSAYRFYQDLRGSSASMQPWKPDAGHARKSKPCSTAPA